MSTMEWHHRRHKRWSEWSTGAKVLVVLGIVVGAPALIAGFVLVTMALWNWLMPVIFGLPRIGFWQSLGILVLAQFLFKGGHPGRAGRAHWKRRQVWKHMQEEGPETDSAKV